MFDYDYTYWPFFSIFYYDPFYLTFFEGQNINSPWYYPFLGPGPMITRQTPPIPLGSTYDAATVTTPSNPEIVLSNAKLYELTASFAVFGSALQTATLNAGSSAHGNEICGNDPQDFEVKVNFKLPPGGVLVPARCKATAQGIPSNNYIVSSVTCMMDSGAAGHLSFHARHRCCGGPDDYPDIRVNIGANKTGQTGTIDTPGRVRVLCNQ